MSGLVAIENAIEDGPDGLQLRFSFALIVLDVEPGSAAEQDYAAGMTADYLKAVDATLAAMRRLAVEGAAAPV